MKYKLEEIAEMTGGKIVGGTAEITGVTKDSRAVTKGDMFIALSGERFDAHNFVPQAAAAGAAAAMTERKVDTDIPQLVTDDVRKALGRFAKAHCAAFSIPKVAVTGSTGKTTTRDITAAVLGAHFKNVLKTQGNYNNDIGLPFTVLGMSGDNDAAVIEMGMNHFGEIDYLTDIVRPDAAIITNVGTAHIENLGSREGILKAKCEIFNGMRPDGLKVLNGDDDMLRTVKGENICFFSVNEKGGDVYASNIRTNGLSGTDFTINTPKGSFEASLYLPGIHIVSDALAAAAVGLGLGLSFDEIAEGLRSFSPTTGRMDIIKCNTYTIIDGTYNANPDSMRASLDVLKNAPGFKCAVLGDMLELGDYSKQLHRQIGEAASGLDMVIAVGKEAYEIFLGTQQNGMYFQNVEAFTEELEKGDTGFIPAGSTVLVKASHSMHFEKIVERLKER